MSDLEVTNGDPSNLVANSGKEYTVDIVPREGTVTASVLANVAFDPATNPNTATGSAVTFVYDTTSPSVSLTSTEAYNSNSASFPITATFAESVTGFSLTSLTVTGGATESLTQVWFCPNPKP